MSNLTDTRDLLQFVCCSVGNETYGLDMSWIISIQHKEHFRYNPNGKEPLGWLEDNIPVINLTGKLGIARAIEKGGKTQRIILLKGKTDPWALMIDDVSQVMSIPLDCVDSLPSIAVNPSTCCFGGVIKLEKELLLLLSPENIYTDGSPNADKPRINKIMKTTVKSKSIREKRDRAGQIVIFSVSEHLSRQRSFYLGLSISQVSEILEPLPIISVPGAPYFVQGIVNWRGNIVPVVDLHARLGLTGEDNKQARSRLVIIRNKSEANEGIYVGFLVEPVVRLLRFPIAAIPCRKNIPANRKLAKTVIELGKEILMIPDMQKIIFGHV